MIDGYYEPGLAAHWSGRIDDELPCRLHQIIKPLDIQNANFSSDSPLSLVFLGCSTEEGIRRNQGKTGASLGPEALRQALANKILHGANFSLFDAGNIVGHENLEATQRELGQAIEKIQKHKAKSIVLGGGHEIAFGHFLGLYGALAPESIGIINIDAHFDVRPLLDEGKGSSGTPFLQIAKKLQESGGEFNYLCVGAQRSANSPHLFATMRELGAYYALAQDVSPYLDDWQLTIRNFVFRHRHIYLSICLDAFASAYAPGVSAPQPLGLDPKVILPALKEMAASGKIVGIDIAELSPPLDINNQTAQLGAQLIVELMQSMIDTEAPDRKLG